MYKAWRNGAAALAVLALLGCGERMSREDFQTRVQNASEKEVSKKIGRPDASESRGPGEKVWVYHQKTFNIEKGNTFDARTVVVFKEAAAGGEARVAEVRFE
ncbi:MAG TPA: hypothetical protein VHP37_33365 [Burkholderiales bacterium]|jgi:hypothetical protein|nr:hypothetical protein [Burkholderiales bacterium]